MGAGLWQKGAAGGMHLRHAHACHGTTPDHPVQCITSPRDSPREPSYKTKSISPFHVHERALRPRPRSAHPPHSIAIRLRTWPSVTSSPSSCPRAVYSSWFLGCTPNASKMRSFSSCRVVVQDTTTGCRPLRARRLLRSAAEVEQQQTKHSKQGMREVELPGQADVCMCLSVWLSCCVMDRC